ncbi:MAG: glycogen/starch/alpha-glucan phosphorylase [Thermodesulfobacteriales bacterium]|nr:MAG: glycogen/starch/alpha-glucan phosphorylase [Thermodesulfobacteriales bacterium]
MIKTNVNFAREATSLSERIVQYLKYSMGKRISDASSEDIFYSLGLAVREIMIDSLFKTEDRYNNKDVKSMYYLSLEYLIGRSLSNNLINLGIYDLCKDALEKIGIQLSDLIETESDAALGNGGLGRLAACFLDSIATLGMPGFGYGINYEYGIFKQKIVNGYQIEQPDYWLREESPWLIEKSHEVCIVPLYGRVEIEKDVNGNYRPFWKDWKFLYGVPYDMPIVGYGGNTVNYLRLYSARASNEFDMNIFNSGDYVKAVEQKTTSEVVSKVLYPSDTVDQGKELRVLQEYFLVSCSMRDIVRRYMKRNNSFGKFASKVAIQLNDTHPALAIVELMRILVDENSMPWHRAWNITESTFGYTNHTLLPEAMETWPLSLFERILPRHLQIIYDINKQFLNKVSSKWPADMGRISRMSIIEEGSTKQVRMAHLSIVGSHSVNGVAALHSKLITTDLVPDFFEMMPKKFNNKTNGITQRRWLLNVNPELAGLISNTIGDAWITDLYKLKSLEDYDENDEFVYNFQQIKNNNKQRLSEYIFDVTHIKVNPESLFDIHVKRIHEYKRQLLNIMHIIHQYYSIVQDGLTLKAPKTYVFAGKAAPGYWAAKNIIKLINNLAQLVNNDKRVNDQIKVVFLPDYKVSLAAKIIPAADVSEHISTAGKEASGTSNMKFALNGALTIGTLDGANIEIMEEVGQENIFVCGLKTEEIKELIKTNSYDPYHLYENNNYIRRVMDSFKSDALCQKEPGLFNWIYESLVHNGDVYYHLADFESYAETQKKIELEFTNKSKWTKKAILNVARIGKFSSDRTISEYAKDIWGIKKYLD